MIAARLNAKFEAAGKTIRLDEAWFFSVGHGTPPFRRLRTGSGRWVNPRSVTYAIDQKPADVAKHTFGAAFTDADVIAAIIRGHERYNQVDNIVLHSTRDAAYTGLDANGQDLNDDILDGMIFADHDNNPATPDVCVDVVDLTSPRVLAYNPVTQEITFNPVAG